MSVEDTPQNFEILMVNRAFQGFTDVTFDYDEVFCSCKLDCLDEFLPDETPTSDNHTQYDRAPTIAFAAACTGGGDVVAADGYCEGACVNSSCSDGNTCTADSDCGQCGSNQACIGIGAEKCLGVTITHDVETAMGLHGGMVCCCELATGGGAPSCSGTPSCVSYDPVDDEWENPNNAPWFGNAEEYDGAENIENKEYNNHAISFDLDWLADHNNGTWGCKVLAQAEVDWTEDGVTDPEGLQNDYANGDFSMYWEHQFVLGSSGDDLTLSKSCGANVREACKASFKNVFHTRDTNDGRNTDDSADDADNTVALQTPAVNVQIIRDERKDQSMTLNKVHVQADGSYWTNIANIYAFKPMQMVSSQSLERFAFNAQLFAEVASDAGDGTVTWTPLNDSQLHGREFLSLSLYTFANDTFVEEGSCTLNKGTAANSIVAYCNGLSYVTNGGTRYIGIKSGSETAEIRYRFSFATSNVGEKIYPFVTPPS